MKISLVAAAALVVVGSVLIAPQGSVAAQSGMCPAEYQTTAYVYPNSGTHWEMHAGYVACVNKTNVALREGWDGGISCSAPVGSAGAKNRLYWRGDGPEPACELPPGQYQVPTRW